jgi:nucleoside transporter
MNTAVRNRLSVMMFLEFFIWGAWLPMIFAYLKGMNFSSWEQSWILNAFALASFTAMFFSTQFADRNFAAEKFLAVSQLIGGLAILGLFWVPPANPNTPSDHTSFWLFFGLMLLHSLFYVPTISITNSIAFTHLKDAQRDFGLVRLWGTIGWIAASWPFIFILTDWSEGFGSSLTGNKLMEGTRYTFVAAGIASLLLAGFSLALPHTPPKPAGAGREALAWLEAMKLLKVPFLLVLFIVTFFDSAVHACYFIWTNSYLEKVGIPSSWRMPVMSIGQIAEIGTLAILGYCLKKMGWKTTMIIGILGHAVRFGVFALFPLAWVAVTVNVLHGICYAFYFATVYLFVDEFFPKDARSSAQGLFNFLILGLGPFVGNFVWPWLGDVFTIHREFYSVTSAVGLISSPENGWLATTVATPMLKVHNEVDFGKLFLVPSATGLFAALLLAFFFYPPKKATTHVPDEGPLLSEGTAPTATGKEADTGIKAVGAIRGVKE